MKNFLFWLIFGWIIVFWFFFVKENPENTYVVKGQTLINNLLKKTTSIWIANPASNYCVENNWILEIKDEAEGQIGICVFPDWSSCEERAFFRWECSPGIIENQETNNEIQNPTEENEKIFCTEEQKAAEICTMEYMPVCWSDWQTYWNKCGACSQWLDYYTNWECISQKTIDENTCPQYMPPNPDFCPDWIIQDQWTDENWCQLPPACITNE